MMTLRSFTDYIAHSRLKALSVTFIITFIPIIGTVSIIMTGLITLRKGALEGFWMLLAATLPYFILAPFQPAATGYWILAVITASNIFTWLFAALFKRTNSWSIILEAAALIGIIIVTAAHIAKPDLENWWAKQLHEYVTQITTHSKALANDDEEVSKAKIAKAAKASSKQKVSEESTEPDVINFVNAAKPYATGIFSASLLFTALLQLFIARWWQMAAALKEQLRPELYKIRLSSIAGITFLAAIILSYFKIALAQDMLPVLYLAFCVAGLSLVHCIMAKIKAFGWLWLTVFYIVLISSWMVYHLPLGFQLVAMAALLDVWLDWRQRINKRFS